MADLNAPANPATSTATPAAPAAAQGAAAQATGAQPSAAQVIPPALAAMLPPAGAAQPAAGAQPLAQPAAAAPAAAPAAAQPAAEAPRTAAKTPAEEVSELRQQLVARTVREHIVGVATQAGAINPEQVHKLLADELDALPDGRVIVKGDPRADAKQHVAKFLAGNLHMLGPRVPSGGVGTPAAVGAPAAATTIDPKTRDGGTANVRSFMGNLFPQPAPPPGGAAGAR